ncbi:alpha/beta hydrolase [Actinokineospora globicatena]|uniref:alpha/beta hydrolase n=1 Tax=Actinokineospora globicatena TaxID=103729 RepID=UPI002554E89D|nr:alpha/beta hydrolase [Actinokineospora globicatena]
MGTQVLRRFGAVVVGLVGTLVAAVAGLTATVLAAALTSRTALLATAGALVFAGVCVLVGWAAFAVAGAEEARRSGTGFAVVATLLAVVGAMVVFAPPSIPEPASARSDVRYWELPTGSRIAYTSVAARGTVRSDPVVFLHDELGAPADGVSDLGRALAADGYPVYAYDQLGVGRSARLSDPAGYTVARHVADLEAIRITLGAPRLVLIGQSWGASLAAQYLAAHPDRVAKVVFSAPGPLWPQSWPSGVGDPRSADPTRSMALESSPRMMLAAALLTVNPKAAHDFMPDPEADDRSRTQTLLLRDGCPGTASPIPAPLPGFYSTQRTAIDFKAIPDPRPALRGNPTPALILRGTCDHTHPEVAAEYTSTFPNSHQPPIPNAGHALLPTTPPYQTHITAFLHP